jgi:hypothetical protein
VHNLRDLREISGQPYSFLFLYESEIKSAQRESCGRNEAAQAARAQLRRIIIKHLREDTTLLEQTVDMLQGKQTIPNNLRESIAKILKVDTSSDKGVSPEFISGHCELSGDPDGILSEVAPAYSTRDPLQDIASDPRGWINYKSAEESPDTISGILQNMEKKWALTCTTWAEVVNILCSDQITLSKLALICCARASTRVHQGERIILPRVLDVAQDVLDLIQFIHPEEEIWFFGTDVSYAFHQIPLRQDEWRFTVAEFAGKYYGFTVLVFGSASAPTV